MAQFQTENLINKFIDKHRELKGFSNYLTDISVKTKYQYLIMTEKFLKYVDRGFSSITLNDYSVYMNQIKYTEDGKQTTQGYQISIYSALKRFSEYLYISKYCPEDFMKLIKRPKFYETQRTIIKRENGYLTPNEIRTVLAEFSDKNLNTWEEYRDYTIIMLFLNTGMRRTALTKINVDDFDANQNVITVMEKGSKIREFYLNKEMCNILKKWIELRNSIGEIKTNALFITKKKTNIKNATNQNLEYMDRITGDNIYSIVLKYTNCIKGKHITPHKLRATYGTQLYNETKDIYFVQHCMGHANPQTTERYIRGIENQTKNASAVLEKLFE